MPRPRALPCMNLFAVDRAVIRCTRCPHPVHDVDWAGDREMYSTKSGRFEGSVLFYIVLYLVPASLGPSVEVVVTAWHGVAGQAVHEGVRRKRKTASYVSTNAVWIDDLKGGSNMMDYNKCCVVLLHALVMATDMVFTIDYSCSTTKKDGKDLVEK